MSEVGEVNEVEEVKEVPKVRVEVRLSRHGGCPQLQQEFKVYVSGKFVTLD